MDSIIIKCANCGTKNRIPKDRVNDSPVCGKCHILFPPVKLVDHPVDITDQSFEDEIVKFPGTVLLDCWAPWCGPCKSIAPILEQLAKEYAGKVKIAKLNVDQNPQTASRFNIKSIPTMMLFKNGKVLNTLVGALPKSEIEKHIAHTVATGNINKLTLSHASKQGLLEHLDLAPIYIKQVA
ncbi:MAG: thioredoxin TrxC, partial [Desulfobacterales bacterium]|nr:thioredoxin TrxC [Desulfobacterales bacterium]